MNTRIAAILCGMLFAGPAPAQTVMVLDRKGGADLSIAIPKGADTVLRFAAAELRHYLSRVTGRTSKLLQGRTSRSSCIQLGDPAFDPGFDARRLGEDGFRIVQRAPATIAIYGNTSRGTLNGVYHWLELYLGFRYYARGALSVPQWDTRRLEPADDVQVPRFRRRMDHNAEAYDEQYLLWHKLSYVLPRIDTNRLGLTSEMGLFVHTYNTLVPPAVHYAAHPEYYAFKGGARLTEQLCLSNDTVFRILTDSLRARMQRQPAATFWSVSQNDNYGYCECDRCRQTDAEEGSHAGSLLRFVNRVAAMFPDRTISTLAYQYSRKPPRLTKPLPNVNIMLCTIECGRSKPLSAYREAGNFVEDIEGWAALTARIFLWDYVINFNNLVMPFPNFQVLQPNLRLFARYGADYAFQQGCPMRGGDMQELRCYLIAKLLWNPDQNVDSLVADFTNGYYGPAGPYIRQYVRLMTMRLNQSGKELYIYHHPVQYADSYLSDDALQEYERLLQQAAWAVSGDAEHTRRVEAVRQGLRYARLEIAKAANTSDSPLFVRDAAGDYRPNPVYRQLLDTFAAFALRNGPPILHEVRLRPEEYYRATLRYLEEGRVRHLALGKKPVLPNGYAPQYAAGGDAALTDGVKGADKYQSQWQGLQGKDMVAELDLGAGQRISGFEMDFFIDQSAWIFPPGQVDFSFSSDGVSYQTIVVSNPGAREKTDAGMRRYTGTLPVPVEARYIRVVAKNSGDLPSWHPSRGQTWLFADEIVVR